VTTLLKVLSTSALSLALAGSAVFAGVSANDSTAKPQSKYEISLAHHVGATPELVDKAKELGIDISKADPAEKAAVNGAKFQQEIIMLLTDKQKGMFQF
jgi:immune inhibitor A